jgi:hypothetical protein
MKTKREPASLVDTSGASIRSGLVAAMEPSESKNSSANTTATTQNASTKTWKSAELAELLSKAGLVAGALADFQTAKGLVAVKETTYKAPSGKVCKAIKLFLIVEDVDLVAVKTADGLDFNLVAEE